MFFFVGLGTIVILNAELVTSNMMYVSYAVVGKKTPWHKAALVLIVCVIGNLVGAVIIGYLLGQSAAYSGLTQNHSSLSRLTTSWKSTPWGFS